MVSLIAVIVLFLIAYVGVEAAAGLQFIFGIVIPYVAIIVFIAGVIYRVVRSGYFVESQQHTHHFLHLRFVGATIARNRLFDNIGLVFGNWHTGVGQGQQDHAQDDADDSIHKQDHVPAPILPMLPSNNHASRET